MNTQTVINSTNVETKSNSNSKINTKVQVQSSVVLLTHPDVILIINESSGAKLLSITDLNDKKFWTGGGQVAKRTNFEYLILVFSVAVDIEKFSKAILDTKLLYSVINISKPWPKKIDKTTTVDEKDTSDDKAKVVSAGPIKSIKKRSVTPRVRKTVAPPVHHNVAPQVANVVPPVHHNVAPQVANVAPQVANVAPPVANVTPQVPNKTENADTIRIPVSNGINIINIPRSG